MKIRTIQKFLAICLTGAVLASCGLGKMAKKAGEIKYDVLPNPLQVNGDRVEINITGKFPEKFFIKKATAEFTPILKYTNGETEYPEELFQGEDAAGNGKVVPYDKGSSFAYTQSVPYNADMEVSELFIKVIARKGSKEKEFDPIKVADGVITTPYLVLSDDKLLIGGDNFVRTTSHTEAATINYIVNRSEVRRSELKDEDMTAFSTFIGDAKDNKRIALKGMEVMAYASPEGEISLNENLADERAASAADAIKAIMNSNDQPEGKDEKFFKLVPKGEDWLGFKDLMQKSEIEDKDLILRILEMYADVNKREQEIKNLAATYVEVAETILPQLRRSNMTLNYDKVGKSDEEISQLAKTNNAELDQEELLYAASLTQDVNEQLGIYQAAETRFADDWRGVNNVGYCLMMQNKLRDGQKQFEKAKGLKDNAIIANNLGVCARLNGDREKAEEMFAKGSSAGSEVAYNLGIVNIQNGDYEAAVGNMSGAETFNNALAKLLAGDAEGALRVMDTAPEKETAMGYYLKAVIGSRMNNLGLIKENLEAAINADASLKAKAKRDAEFLKYKDSLGSILN